MKITGIRTFAGELSKELLENLLQAVESGSPFSLAALIEKRTKEFLDRQELPDQKESILQESRNNIDK